MRLKDMIVIYTNTRFDEPYTRKVKKWSEVLITEIIKEIF